MRLTFAHRTAPHRTVQHSTAQHSTAQHSTAQHSTAQQAQLCRAPCRGVLFCTHVWQSCCHAFISVTPHSTMLLLHLPGHNQMQHSMFAWHSTEQLRIAGVLQGVRSADKLPELLACIHTSNATLRWLVLHMAGSSQSKLSTAVAKQAVDKDALVKLLLDTAFLESWVGSSFHSFIHYTHLLPPRSGTYSPECIPIRVPVLGGLSNCCFSCFCNFSTNPTCLSVGARLHSECRC